MTEALGHERRFQMSATSPVYLRAGKIAALQRTDVEGQSLRFLRVPATSAYPLRVSVPGLGHAVRQSGGNDPNVARPYAAQQLGALAFR